MKCPSQMSEILSLIELGIMNSSILNCSEHLNKTHKKKKIKHQTFVS